MAVCLDQDYYNIYSSSDSENPFDNAHLILHQGLTLGPEQKQSTFWEEMNDSLIY